MARSQQQHTARLLAYYVHCWGGCAARWLEVAACLLGALYPELVDADEALERVQSYYLLACAELLPPARERLLAGN